MGFLPTGPFTIASAAIIWSLSLFFLWRGTRAQKHIAVAFIVSWFTARLATVTEMQAVAAVGWTIAALVSFRGASMFAKAIASLYAVRLLVLSMAGIALSWYTFWELNRVFLYLQIALAIGTLIHGSMAAATGRHRDRRADPRRAFLARWSNIFSR